MTLETLPVAGAIGAEGAEVRAVLPALRRLMARAPSPVVRACPEEAHDDIAYLTGAEEPPASLEPLRRAA